MKNIAVFVSGTGSNCENIIRHFRYSEVARVALVVSSRADAYALVRAERLAVPSVVLTRAALCDAERVLGVLRSYDVDFIVLAGFLLMVPPFLVRAYAGRMVNIHPALLPKYGGKGMYGIHVHRAVRQAGESETGITVHWVNEEYDRGDIIARFAVAISSDDSVDDIAAKVHTLEMQHFPSVIEQVVSSL